MDRLKITQSCQRCGELFYPWTLKTKYCSRVCQNGTIKRECLTCGAPFLISPCRAATAKWCSRKCANTAPLDFWETVNKSNDCWTWTASRDKDGYGKFQQGRAHRTSYEMHYGPIPDGLCVLHRCDNPPCVRPEHLFLGTKTDNMADKIKKGRQPRGEQIFKSKLTAGDVRQIRAMMAAGARRKAVAALFNVDPTNISCIVLRKTWFHISD